MMELLKNIKQQVEMYLYHNVTGTIILQIQVSKVR